MTRWAFSTRTKRMRLEDAHRVVRSLWPSAHWNATINEGYWFVDGKPVAQAIAVPTARLLLEENFWWVRVSRPPKVEFPTFSEQLVLPGIKNEEIE